MLPSRFVDQSDDYKEVLEVLGTLPDEKMPAQRVEEQLSDAEYDVTRCIQDFISLGEVELCQERGTGGRIWLKRRSMSGEHISRPVAGRLGWQCYAVKGCSEWKAERVFTTRDAAMLHLSESAVVDPAEYERIPFLEDVWATKTRGGDGYAKMLAVVRPVTAYTIPNASERLGRSD